jgi:UDP-GlcNAc:undecaprenyl-phosphate/decaprenyl-phosphate GlcNAc-1-phosphate transferase
MFAGQNSFNFLDGADGVCAGVAGIIAVAYALLPEEVGSEFGHVLAWSVTGACVVFLRFNLPAKVFLGDSGSTALGFTVAFVGIDLFRHSGSATNSTLLFALLVSALPLRSGVSPLHGDNAHLTDLLREREWPRRRVALACCGVTTIFAVIGLWGLRVACAYFAAGAACSTTILAFVLVRLGSLRRQDGDEPARRPIESFARENQKNPA